MSALILVASSDATGSASFLESLEIQAIGVAVVLVALGLLALLVAMIERLLQRSQRKPQVDVLAAPSSEQVVVSDSEQVPDEVWAVIAASIFHTLGSAHRVLRVEPVSNIQLQAWSVEGRRQIFQSHQLR